MRGDSAGDSVMRSDSEPGVAPMPLGPLREPDTLLVAQLGDMWSLRVLWVAARTAVVYGDRRMWLKGLPQERRPRRLKAQRTLMLRGTVWSHAHCSYMMSEERAESGGLRAKRMRRVTSAMAWSSRSDLVFQFSISRCAVSSCCFTDSCFCAHNQPIARSGYSYTQQDAQ